MATEEAVATVGTRGYTSLLQKADVSLRHAGRRELVSYGHPRLTEQPFVAIDGPTVGIHCDGTNTSPNIS
jgi:hypothetical protein